MTKTIVVFDHHRQSSNMIENTVLSYIEPYASSSCEMVSEVLQYITDDVRITNVEANSMYAGIVIDTNNFMNRTGVINISRRRIFEKMRSGYYLCAEDFP